MKTIVLLGWCLAALGITTSGRAQNQEEEKPRTAVVNIQELFRNYYKTRETQREIDRERERIQKEHNDMQGRLRSLDAGLRQLAERLQATDLEPAEKQALERERGLRFQEREMFSRESRNTVRVRHGELNRKMVVRMRSLLTEIREIVAKKAEAEGYDLVFDREGLNSSQVPSVMFAKDATDITPIILKEINKDAPDGD